MSDRVRGLDAGAVMDPPAFLAGTVRLGVGDLLGAAEIAQDLLTRYPGHPEAKFLYAMAGYWHCEQTLEATAAAAALLEEVVADRPDFTIGLFNLGFLRQRQGDDAAASALYERVLALDPSFIGAHVNLGNAKLAAGDMAGALACFTAATRYNARDPLVRKNRAIAYLLTGRYDEGWADYEARWETPLFRAKFPRPDLPVWDGTPQPDKRLLVFSEQGYGDTIMCYRYARQLEALFPRGVTWRVQEKLATLLNAVPDTEPYPDADLCVPTMSLMHRLGMPKDGAPYLHDRRSSAHRRIGYVWAGSVGHEADFRRSTDPAMWDGLLSRTDYEWVDLQMGRGGTFQAKDWNETADVIATLGLVITVDTAVAHLAGALGVPVWILLPSVPDYRWGLTGERTPWYDSARLFRQERDGDWPAVFERVALALDQRP